MQLSNHACSRAASASTLRPALLAASCALLNAAMAHADSGNWQVDTALLMYSEGDSRVQTTEPVIALQRDCGDDCALNFKFTYDTLSGSSPNGALPSSSAQTFTTPSGYSLNPTYTTTVTTTTGGTQTSTSASGSSTSTSTRGGTTTTTTVTHINESVYSVAAGALPLAAFTDKRQAFSIGWTQPLSTAVKLSLNGDYSHETDFQSSSAGGSLAVDLFNRNTTLSVGANLERDQIKPIGGAPAGGSAYADFEKTGNQHKQMNSALAGITQVMNRRWLLQLNYSMDRISGYQNDPYKIVSLITSTGTTSGYVFENRPQQRTRNSLYMDNRLAIGRNDVLGLSVRQMNDDWGINSQTADLRYRWQWSKRAYIEPHVRYYQQTAADFYYLYLSSDATQPTYLSADSRLAAFDARTLGIKLGFPTRSGGELAVRFEAYQQTGRNVARGVGTLQQLDLYPDLVATMCQLSWRF